jgi:hypothetical protein
MNAAEVLNRLKAGNDRFVNDKLDELPETLGHYFELSRESRHPGTGF